MSPVIRAVARALPARSYGQQEVLAAAASRWNELNGQLPLLERFFRNSQVERRHFVLPLAAYGGIETFAAANEVWEREALDLAEEASRKALDRAGIAPSEVGHVFFVSTTGIATPSLDAPLANRLGFPEHVRRTPVFGLGCAGGAAGIARAADVLRAHPRDVALLVAVELCTLTMQRGDVSIANLVATALFGDGAAAVVMTGADVPAPPSAPRVVASRSVLFRDTEAVMGWAVRDSGLGVLLSTDVPEIARDRLAPVVRDLLREAGVDREQVSRWIFHSGGPKVLDGFVEGLGLPADALDLSRASLSSVGNLSSATVLVVLEDHLAAAPPTGSSYAALASMGPGFGAEVSLLSW
jgi:alkylresorcinol/alkylpyrone synthase